MLPAVVVWVFSAIESSEIYLLWGLTVLGLAGGLDKIYSIGDCDVLYFHI